MGQILTATEMARACREMRAQGKTLVFANGHFDLLHVGHLRYLYAAKGEGDVLIVGLNGDGSVARLKGAGRPIVPADERAELLSALEPVDFVVIFEDDSPAGLMAELRPDVHCKGPDYGSTEEVPEFDVVRSWGGRTALVGDPKDHSTRDLISQVKEIP